MKYVVNLSQCAQCDETLVGGKAKNLGILIREGLNVPAGFCLTTTAFRSIQGIDEMFREYLNRYTKNDPSCIKILSNIRKMTLSFEFQENMQEELFNVWKSQKKFGKIAVRSSAVGEDSMNKSYAGIYKSYLNIDQYENFLNAVRNVWCSVFSEVAMYYRNKTIMQAAPQMAVIIQNMAVGHLSGVLFSRNPLNPSENMMVAEGAFDAGDIVKGIEPQFTCRIARDETSAASSEKLSENEMLQLKNNALKIENMLNGPVDMEWISDKKDIFILQARPLSIDWSNRDNALSCELIPLDHIEKCEKLDLDSHGYRESYIKWLSKKYWIRDHAKKAGIHCYGEHFLKFTSGQIEEAYELLLNNKFHSNYFIVRGGAIQKKYFALSDIRSLLYHTSKSSPQKKEFMIQLGEVIPVEIGGFSTLLDDGTCLVEYCPGLMTGIMTGDVAPSLIIIDDQLNTVYEDKKQFDEIYIFDEQLLEKRKVNNKASNEKTMNKDLLHRILKMTKYFSSVFREPRIEWYFYDHKLFIKDLSMEENKISVLSDDGKIMSDGYAEGEVVIIKDDELEYLDKLSEELNLSVISRTDEQDHLQIKGNQLTGLPAIVNSTNQQVIVLADRPSTGFIPYLSNVKGFIFNKGSLLCHLGIVLREARIPAHICNSATSLFSDGDKVRLTSNGIIRGM
ncbi:PEP/pyruvate-binding domain-containing protein [Paenibacillus alkalitolerans]|uniref:PEP/pyruvate-binding domain-containing protein n=1 Tax=Paenibacillus alkalitolerans TaxID=2799335 RepID=UPI0018F578C3|nr:PEP/pyruvate-binding domain-containing protein [Paenibacillus alkalitolerans]